MADPRSWLKLKRSLKDQQVRVEDTSDMGLPLPRLHLVPEPIPLDVKVVLVGSPMTIGMLDVLDPDFAALFKIRAEFEPDTPVEVDTIAAYAAFICREADLCSQHFDRSAMREVLRFGNRPRHAPGPSQYPIQRDRRPLPRGAPARAQQRRGDRERRTRAPGRASDESSRRPCADPHATHDRRGQFAHRDQRRGRRPGQRPGRLQHRPAVLRHTDAHHLPGRCRDAGRRQHRARDRAQWRYPHEGRPGVEWLPDGHFRTGRSLSRSPAA